MASPVPQRTAGEGKAGTHTHPALTQTHDHDHVTHHHRAGVGGAVAGGFEHRAYWHSHARTHAELTRGHDDDHAEEEAGHAEEAHVHDHAAPTRSPA